MNGKQKKKTSRGQDGFPDILLPVMIVITLLPLVIYLIMYNSGLSTENWYGENEVLGDFFCYYKSRCFIFVSMIALGILVIHTLIYKVRDFFAFLFPMAYLLFAFISAIFTVNRTDTYIGGIYHFENILVLCGYVIMMIYTYRFVDLDNKEHEKWLRYSLNTSAVLLGILGILQMFGKDLLDNESFLRLITPKEWEEYVLENIKDLFSNHNVSFFFYNSNDAGLYIVLLLPVFLLLAVYSQELRNKILYGTLGVLFVVLLWFTYGRGALLAFLLEFLIGSVLIVVKNSQNRKKILSLVVLFAVICVIMFLVFDTVMEHKFTKRFREQNSKSQLEEILTSKSGVFVSYDDFIFQVKRDHNGDYTLQKGEEELSYDKATGTIDAEGFENIHLLDLSYLQNEEEKEMFALTIDGICFDFVYDAEENMYYYRNDLGKTDSLVHIPAMDFHGYETKGSGRLYIWSRVLPLLKDYILVGSGPDTFYRVFPQNDYVGKKIYTSTDARIIEKAHNGYLSTAIQTGVVSLLLLLVFYVQYAIRFLKYYFQEVSMNRQMVWGLAAFSASVGYLVCGFFYDSSLQCTPFFCVLMGIGLSVTKNTEKREEIKHRKKQI